MGYKGKNQWTCPTSGKVCHTKESAKGAARSLGGQTVSNHLVTSYRCDDWRQHPAGAGHFHIGHKPRGRRRRR